MDENEDEERRREQKSYIGFAASRLCCVDRDLCSHSLWDGVCQHWRMRNAVCERGNVHILQSSAMSWCCKFGSGRFVGYAFKSHDIYDVERAKVLF